MLLIHRLLHGHDRCRTGIAVQLERPRRGEDHLDGGENVGSPLDLPCPRCVSAARAGAGWRSLAPFTAVYNLPGQPAVNVPLYWNADGLPIGVILGGRPGEERTLISLSAQLEAAPAIEGPSSAAVVTRAHARLRLPRRGCAPMLAQVEDADGLAEGTAGASGGTSADAADGGAAGAVGASDGAAAGREYRIGELAHAAGVTVRTLRYYQERKLLPPPRREGRIAWYSQAHLARLRIIAQLLERGHTLGGTGELLSAWEQGYDLAELLGFERAMTAPWSDEVPAPVTVADISALLDGQLTQEVLDEAVRLGYIEVDGDRVLHVSRRLLDTTTALVREGIPLAAILAASRKVQAGLDGMASLFVELVITHVLGRRSGPPQPHEVARLAETIERLRPVARTVIDAEFARAMDRRARDTYSEFIRLLGARDRRAPDASGTPGSRSPAKAAGTVGSEAADLRR